MLRPRTRWTALTCAVLFIFAAAVEVECYTFAQLSIVNGNAFMFYRADLFRLTKQQLTAEDNAGPLGWPSDSHPRPQPRHHSVVCGAAFGDSMTHGDEVKDDDTWVYLLSNQLGCDVQNFGVGAYGLDQAVLRYEAIKPPGRFILIGLFVEMLRRNLAASWTFYQGPIQDHLPRYAITKPFFTMDGSGELHLNSRPSPPVTIQSIIKHHDKDYYLKNLWTPLAFPYSYAVGRALYLHFVRKNYLANETSNYFWFSSHPSSADKVALKLIARMREATNKKGQLLVVVMIPQVYVERNGKPAPYASFISDLKDQEPGLCVIDVHPDVVAAANRVSVAALRAPLGHYTATGSQVLADAAANGLIKCGIITPPPRQSIDMIHANQ